MRGCWEVIWGEEEFGWKYWKDGVVDCSVGLDSWEGPWLSFLCSCIVSFSCVLRVFIGSRH